MHKAERIRVADPELLGRILSETIGAQYETQVAAAEALEINQGHFSRLTRGKIAGITTRLFNTIWGAVPISRLGDLERALLTPRADRLLGQFDAWLVKTLRPFQAPTGRAHAIPGLGELASRPHRPSSQTGRRVDQLEELWATLAQPGSRLDKFYRQQRAKGHSPIRILLALVRVLEPLLLSKEARGIERSWQELKPKEQERYLRAALKKEEILLERAPDLHRAQELASE